VIATLSCARHQYTKLNRCHNPVYDNATTSDTHGVKDLTATFMAETEIFADSLNYDHQPAYVRDRIKTVIPAFKDDKIDPGN